MGAFRDGVFRQLIAADTHRRLRLVYPAASRAQDVPTFVHSKVMIVDDELVRIGSANFSRRSMGVDTECDLAVDAGGDSPRAGGHPAHSRSAARRTSRSAGGCRRARHRARGIAARARRCAGGRRPHARPDRTSRRRRGAAARGAPSRRRSGRADRVRRIGRSAGAAGRRDEPAQSSSPLDSARRARRRPRVDIVGVRQTTGIPGRPGRCSAPSRPCRRWLWIGVGAFLLANLALIPLEAAGDRRRRGVRRRFAAVSSRCSDR